MIIRAFVTNVVAVAILLGVTDVHSFTLRLNSSEFGANFFGPGDQGAHLLVEGEVRNIVLTGPLTGSIPFFNNGADAPNVIAEVLQGNTVDGRVSDGVLINENIDTALMLNLRDSETGDSAKVMVVGVTQELIVPDEVGNLTFNPAVVADPGIPELAVPFAVTFSTGARRVPPSTRTQQGLPGGHDQAGPFPSGHVLIGRLGDFDHNGLLDGILVQAENPPEEFIFARGDPIAQIRPWTSDIPVTPLIAATLALQGIVVNFPEPVVETLRQGRLDVTREYVADMEQRVSAALENLRRALREHDFEEDGDAHEFKRDHHRGIKKARKQLRHARARLEHATDVLENQKFASFESVLTRAFADVGDALKNLTAGIASPAQPGQNEDFDRLVEPEVKKHTRKN